MKKLNLKAKMLLCIIPIMAISMILLTYVATTQSKAAIQSQVLDTADAKLSSNVAQIDSDLEVVRTTAVNIAQMVGATYKFTDEDSYGKSLTKIIGSNSSVTGSGIWFEPNVYDSGEKYVGPYWYKESDGSISKTMDYSNSDYDYFSQEYYTLAEGLTDGTATITDPYYGETSGVVMASCSAPIYDGTSFIGCVTVDMQLEQIDNMVADVRIGDTGSSYLTNSEGMYLYTADSEKLTNVYYMNEDDNTSLAAAATTALADVNDDNRASEFSDGSTKYSLFYKTIPDVNWKLFVSMDQAEMDQEIQRISNIMIAICIAALIIGSIVILLFVESITKNVKHVKEFAGNLAKGDFTISKMKSKRTDELGQMSESLNDMYENNRNVISKISDESGRVSETSGNLINMAQTLSNQFTEIRNNISGVNDAMMSSGAATEEVNASVEEVNASVESLARETEESSSSAAQIKEKAKEIEQQSQQAYDYALSIAEQRGQDLQDANDKAAIVEQVGTLADTIAEIADQINLLSLNASIEAARAGDAGKGFAVVASEINKLASSTSQAVEQIRATITGVQDAFGTLSGSSGELLNFIRETVTPDYGNFVDVAKQYGESADVIGSQAEKIAEMTENIRSAMEEVSKAIQNIAESTQYTADRSSHVNDTVISAVDIVSEVNDMSAKQEAVADSLEGIVGNFKLK